MKQKKVPRLKARSRQGAAGSVCAPRRRHPETDEPAEGHHDDCLERHCDDYIDDPGAPGALRKFLAFARAPAHGQLLPKPHPRLFADHAGTRVRVTMASRLGDVGITPDLAAEMGYERRVPVS